MGALGNLNQWRKKAVKETRLYKLQKELELFYATHVVSAWQHKRVGEIRGAYEVKERALDLAWQRAVAGLSEQFIQFELEFLRASHEWKEKNPGKEMPVSFNAAGLVEKALEKGADLALDTFKSFLNPDAKKD